jgi:periodic tryptophan protein 1
MAFDVRTETKPLWTLRAHDEGVNGLSLSSQCPDCIVTVSSDSTFKVWDIADGKPSCVAEKDMAMGKLQCSDFCPDAPFVVGLGGDRSSNFVKVTDIRDFLTGNYAALRKLLEYFN